MNNITITPFGDQILVKPYEAKQILVSEQKSLCKYGKVLAVGDEVQKIKVGDWIGFFEFGMKELKIENETHYFIQEDPRFVLGILGMPEQLPA